MTPMVLRAIEAAISDLKAAGLEVDRVEIESSDIAFAHRSDLVEKSGAE